MTPFHPSLRTIPLLLALLLACTRGSIPAEVTSPDTAPPEPAAAEPATSATAPAPRHQNIAFRWESADDGTSGTIRTTLPDGESFMGRFHQITRTTTVDRLGDFYDTWYGGPWSSPTWTWGDAWPYYASTEEFITNYSDKALATLTGDRGTMMRCHFRLEDPDRGMSGGGSGECQLSDGQRITARFDAQ